MNVCFFVPVVSLEIGCMHVKLKHAQDASLCVYFFFPTRLTRISDNSLHGVLFIFVFSFLFRTKMSAFTVDLESTKFKRLSIVNAFILKYIYRWTNFFTLALHTSI